MPPAKYAIENCAKICHEANRILCLTTGDDSQVHWEESPQWQRDSAIIGVTTIVETPPGEITPGMLHEGWASHKRAEGWVYGPVKNAEAKTHPCLITFDELPPNQQAKDDLFLAIVRAYFYL